MIKQDKERQRQTIFVAKKKEREKTEKQFQMRQICEREKNCAPSFFSEILFLTTFESKKRNENINFFLSQNVKKTKSIRNQSNARPEKKGWKKIKLITAFDDWKNCELIFDFTKRKTKSFILACLVQPENFFCDKHNLLCYIRTIACSNPLKKKTNTEKK